MRAVFPACGVDNPTNYDILYVSSEGVGRVLATLRLFYFKSTGGDSLENRKKPYIAPVMIFHPAGSADYIRLTAELAQEQSGTRPDPHFALSPVDHDTPESGKSFPTLSGEQPSTTTH